MPIEQQELSDRINEYYPTKFNKADWQWRTPFRTETCNFDDINDKQDIFEKLDSCLQKISAFEADMKNKLF